jgi:hypothetical protein
VPAASGDDINNLTSGGYVDLINAGWESAYTYGDSTDSTSDQLTSPFAAVSAAC